MNEISLEPAETRPWRPEDGAPPQVWLWPQGHAPALLVYTGKRWRWALVTARQDWANGRVVYQATITVHGSTTTHLYPWPQPGLRVCSRGSAEPYRAAHRPT
ncbi:hypothetical protein [Streptomyces sp. NPDC127084]|uniref:hypothetical protein n=1 Tax=Streptomyces sp. NPDC127084 TaxID=3347133 RepID=UPI0036539BD0